MRDVRQLFPQVVQGRPLTDSQTTVITDQKYQGSWDPKAAPLLTPPASPGPVWGTVNIEAARSLQLPTQFLQSSVSSLTPLL